MIRLQSVPPQASEYSAAQHREIEELQRLVAAKSLQIGTRFDAGWSLVGPSIIADVARSQRAAIGRARDYIPELLEATGQEVEADVDPIDSELVGLTGSGHSLTQALDLTPIRAKQAVERGATPRDAASFAGSWLTATVGTIVADTARSAEGLGMFSHRVRGYVRMVNGGACGRCVILAGRWYRTSSGFLRHRRCRCVHIPAPEDVAGDWQTNPRAYFGSLNDAQQIKLMGSRANAQAMRDGADMAQIVNAYRRSGALQFAQESPIKLDKFGRKFTTEGTTKRGIAHKAQARLRTNGPAQVRAMPETIYRRATSHEDALRMLRLYGWIL